MNKSNDTSKCWYMAPEQIFRESHQPLNFVYQFGENVAIRSEKLSGDFSSDMWALGCVFAEMFISVTPLFQAVDINDKAIRFFEVSVILTLSFEPDFRCLGFLHEMLYYT